MNVITARTKLDARATSKTETAVTIDFSTISQDDLQKLAAKTIVIAAQAEWRAAGSVPESVTLNAHDYANPAKKPRGPVDPKQALKTALAAWKKENPEGTLEDFIASLA